MIPILNDLHYQNTYFKMYFNLDLIKYVHFLNVI